MIIIVKTNLNIVFVTRNNFKKIMQTTLNTFSEVLYVMHVEVMINLDHYNSIELET